MKFGFGICNKKEKSWVSDKVWNCIYKEIKGKKAEKWWGLIQSFDFACIHDQTNRKKTLAPLSNTPQKKNQKTHSGDPQIQSQHA